MRKSVSAERATPANSGLRTEQLTDRLLDAASRLFMEKGFESTSMAEIARSAQASKETFYRYYPSKEDLFRAVILRRAKLLAVAMGASLVTKEPPRKALTAFGDRVLSGLATMNVLALHRVLLMERERFPDLAGLFHRQGPARVKASVSRYLDAQIAKGTLRKINTGVAARQFFDLLAADMMRAIMMGHAKPSKTQIEQRVKEAVDCFLHGYSA